jgi:predicted acyltransferase
MVTTITNPQSTARPTEARLVSVDVLRGITIAFMILVNNGFGDYPYAPLQHSVWNGWTPTDLVFPTFLFVVGITIVFSFESRLARGASRTTLLAHTFRRASILFLLGLFDNGFPFFPLGTWRIYGVLQRIAICFLIASALYLWDRRTATKVIAIVVALGGYWFLMRWVPVPGFGLPGRDIPLLDPNRNLVAFFDRHIFPGRLYEGVRDPEGLLSTLPAVATTLLGMLTGMWLRSAQSRQAKAVGMLVAGVIGISLGLIWGHWFPINKKLWTSSYVLLAAGWALVALSICYWVIDVKGWKKGWTYVWIVFGMNAITAYVFSQLLEGTLSAIPVRERGHAMNVTQYIFYNVFGRLQNFQLASLAYCICFVVICFIPVLLLYRKGVFIKV